MKLPEPTRREAFNGQIFWLYTHEQLIQALKDWSEEIAQDCETTGLFYATGEIHAKVIREKARELDK